MSLNLLYMIIYSLCKLKCYSFDKYTSTLLYCVCLNIQYLLSYFQQFLFIRVYTLKIFLPGHIPCLGPGLHFHNICFELDETWCVNYHRLDEPWVPPGSNCPHHQSDCKLTNSAGHQLMQRLQHKRKARRDDGIIRYLCMLLCLVQRGVAHNSGSGYSVCHLLHYKGW